MAGASSEVEILIVTTQAQFMIPMTISLGFGILFAILPALILVPINFGAN